MLQRRRGQHALAVPDPPRRDRGPETPPPNHPAADVTQSWPAPTFAELPTTARPVTQTRFFRTELPTARETPCVHLHTNVRRLRRRLERITLWDWIAYWRARGAGSDDHGHPNCVSPQASRAAGTRSPAVRREARLPGCVDPPAREPGPCHTCTNFERFRAKARIPQAARSPHLPATAPPQQQLTDDDLNACSRTARRGGPQR